MGKRVGNGQDDDIFISSCSSSLCPWYAKGQRWQVGWGGWFWETAIILRCCLYSDIDYAHRDWALWSRFRLGRFVPKNIHLTLKIELGSEKHWTTEPSLCWSRERTIMKIADDKNCASFANIAFAQFQSHVVHWTSKAKMQKFEVFNFWTLCKLC